MCWQLVPLWRSRPPRRQIKRSSGCWVVVVALPSLLSSELLCSAEDSGIPPVVIGQASCILPVMDTYSSAQAARILGVTDRHIRVLLGQDELEGHKNGGGSWLISQASVHALLERRREESPTAPEMLDAETTSGRLRDLEGRVEELNYRLGRADARVELTEVAQSTVHEQLERERQRADAELARSERLEREGLELQRANERLVRELREARRGWWLRRVFGRAAV